MTVTRLLPAPDLFGHVTFCDDIRFEADGKVNFIGTYRGTIFIHVPFPASLPKFYIGVFFAQQRELFDANLSIWIYLPEDSDQAEASIRIEATEAAKGAVERRLNESGDLREDMTIIQIAAQIILSPLLLNKEGVIRVRVLRQGELHRLGSIRIALSPNVQQPSPTEESTVVG
jgi:hypothetical protein